MSAAHSLAAVVLLALAAPAAGAGLDARQLAGKRIYEEGTGRTGGEIRAFLGGSPVPASAVTCASCHGEDGLGAREGGPSAAPDITWRRLGGSGGHVHVGGRTHAAFDARSAARAVTDGTDPAGNALDASMPRYSLSREDQENLVAYLRVLEGEREPGVAARVNGVAIGATRLERYVDDYLREKGRSMGGIRSPAAFKAMQREALDKLIEAELLWQEAQRRKKLATQAEVDAALAEARAGFKTPDEFQRRLERSGFTAEAYARYLRQQLSIRKLVQDVVVARVSVPDADVRAFYDANPDRFARPEQIRVRHVLVKVAPTAPEEERAKARARIEELLARARAGAPFDELAREHSEDGSAAQGGDLGFFGHGQMVRPFEEAAFALAPGETSDVVQTVFGFHVLRAEERRGGEPIPFAEARDGIREKLLAERAQEALAREVKALRDRGRVVVARSY